ncbi:MAG: hypothetical protein K0Q49_1767 [Haloplasmataceae bacterium]|jgi:hypothetical protein|nr:hypothetical protein [Haloplasmataceae bacterium]
MERYLLFLYEAINAKKGRTKSIVKPIIFIMFFIFLLFSFIILKDFKLTISDLWILFGFIAQLIPYIFIFTYFYLYDRKFIYNIQYCINNYETDRSGVLKRLNKFNRRSITFYVILNYNWKYFAKRAYEILLFYNQETYSRFNVNETILEIDINGTKSYYQEIDEVNNNDLEIINTLIHQFKELLQKFGVNLLKPDKIHKLLYNNNSEYTLEYLVYGFVVNKSNFFTNENKMLPFIIDNQTIRFYEINNSTEKPCFYIIVEIITN